MKARIRILRRTRIFHKPIYALETRNVDERTWNHFGEMNGNTLGRMLERLGIHPTESSLVMDWAIEAYRASDSRWVYPEWGVRDGDPTAEPQA